MSFFDAPRERKTSSNSGSTVAKPAATFTTIGKKANMNAVIIAGGVPIPNQITKIGTIATLGTELNAISSGYNARYNKVDQPTAIPIPKPPKTAKTKPINVVKSVCQA